ncbi:hypothetical protein [Tolumonas osonensis]|uniref:Uncharacterized protein n=1 Tax=Tolumonas osonensis TaxID=675874 RepID=A0A841GMC8_9GAMM|nr:hypothetical protein [Tolumonas osonensis]MBB6054653.1 hypothetical protein [Tolumonas osonensis]
MPDKYIEAPEEIIVVLVQAEGKKSLRDIKILFFFRSNIFLFLIKTSGYDELGDMTFLSFSSANIAMGIAFLLPYMFSCSFP